MKTVRWNQEKAQLIKETRNIDFNRIAAMIEESELLGIVTVPNRGWQKMFLLDYDDYVVCVPFVEKEHEIFLKTAYKNRKLNRSVKGNI